MVKDAPGGRAVGIWNTSSDALIAPEVALDGAFSSVTFINAAGRLEGDRVVVTSDIPAWSFAGFELKK